MGAFETIKNTVADLPISDIYKARLEFALDQSSALERQVSELQTELGKIRAELQMECTNHQKTRQELQKLQGEHIEQIRLWRGVEFRRGVRTGGSWMPFCAKCHLPIVLSSHGGEHPVCSDDKCRLDSANDVSGAIEF